MKFKIYFLIFIYIHLLLNHSYAMEPDYSSLGAPLVKVFPVGQGNCVAVKYKRKVILIDMGSNEHTFQHFYQERSLPKEKDFIINKRPSESAGSSPPLSPGLHQSLQDSGSLIDERDKSPSQVSHGQGSFSSDETTLTGEGAAIQSKWENVLNTMVEFLSFEDIDHIVFVGSHSDKDHVGDTIIRNVFFEEIGSKRAPRLAPRQFLRKLKTIVLGGFPDDYSHVEGTLAELKRFNEALDIIFTASHDGKANKPRASHTQWFKEVRREVEGYARPYCTFIREKTDIEADIEKALQFSDDGLKVQVLAMNVGHSVHHAEDGRQFVTVSNKDPNSNSIVLRFIRERGQSFLVPGDADYATWNYIETMSGIYGENLKTDYMIVSHHGSGENDATRESILRVFKPKCLIISSGRHQRYHHPHGETIDLIRRYFDLIDLITDDHELTYYRGVEEGQPKKVVYHYKRINTKKPIFSTVVNGEIHFSLEQEEERAKITVSQKKPRLFRWRDQNFMAIDQSISINSEDFNLLFTLGEGRNIRIWEETGNEEEINSRTYHLINNPRVIEPTEFAAAAAAAPSPSVPVSEVGNVVTRKVKGREGSFYVYYTIEPVQTEEKPDS